MECGEDGGLPQHRSVPAIKSVVGTDLLCVISGEAQKNCDTDQTVDPVQRAEEGEKQGDYAEDQQENEHGVVGRQSAGADRHLLFLYQAARDGQGCKHGHKTHEQHNQPDAHI